MRRQDLEHIIRASAAIAGDHDIVIVGSQSILGAHPDAPDELLVSREADVFPLHHPDRADLIEGGIGEMSPFDETYGFYAQAVGPETVIAPEGWLYRAIRVRNANTQEQTGWCMEPHDCALAKLAAGRPKDHDFVRALLRHGLVSMEVLRDRLETMPVSKTDRARLDTTLQALGRAAAARHGTAPAPPR